MSNESSPPKQGSTLDEVRYQNFDLAVREEGGSKLLVTVRQSPSGEAQEIIQFPFDNRSLERQQDKLRIALGMGGTRQVCSEDEKPVQDFGKRLFNVMFTGNVLSRYD